MFGFLENDLDGFEKIVELERFENHKPSDTADKRVNLPIARVTGHEKEP